MDTTKIDTFLEKNGISTVALADKAGLSRQHLIRIRLGQCASPGLAIVRAIVVALRSLTGKRVRVEDLFEI